MKKLLGMRGAVVIRFGQPMDPFGNRVDERGASHDARGREVDPSSYVKNARGEVVIDGARDAQYTRELGEEICRAYARDTVVMATHLVAAACFARLRSASPAGDLFTVLRQREAVTVPRDDLAREVVRIRDELLALEREGAARASDTVRRASGGDIVEGALRAFAGYHTAPVLRSTPEGIVLADTNLLFYYQNRLAAHGLGWDVIAPPGAAAGEGPRRDQGGRRGGVPRERCPAADRRRSGEAPGASRSRSRRAARGPTSSSTPAASHRPPATPCA